MPAHQTSGSRSQRAVPITDVMTGNAADHCALDAALGVSPRPGENQPQREHYGCHGFMHQALLFCLSS